MAILNKTLVMIAFFTFTLARDYKACKLFKENLAIIKECVKGKRTLNVSKVSEAINFLEQITKIKSNSDGNYFGRFNPTQEDYNRWNRWFKKNKAMLYWDEINQTVKVKVR